MPSKRRDENDRYICNLLRGAIGAPDSRLAEIAAEAQKREVPKSAIFDEETGVANSVTLNRYLRFDRR